MSKPSHPPSVSDELVKTVAELRHLYVNMINVTEGPALPAAEKTKMLAKGILARQIARLEGMISESNR